MVVISENGKVFGPFSACVISQNPHGLMCDDVFLPFSVIGDQWQASEDDSLVSQAPTSPPFVSAVAGGVQTGKPLTRSGTSIWSAWRQYWN